MTTKPTHLSLAGKNVDNFNKFLNSLKKPNQLKIESDNQDLLSKWKSEGKIKVK